MRKPYFPSAELDAAYASAAGAILGHLKSCDAACDPSAPPTPEVDLTPALAASIERAKAHNDMKDLASALGATFYVSGEYCATCGDLIDQNDADNQTRTGYKAGRIDCGSCVRLMRKVGTD